MRMAPPHRRAKRNACRMARHQNGSQQQGERKERVRNNFPKWAWRVQSDADKMRSFGRIDDAGWLPG
jgi:hypothetical protein